MISDLKKNPGLLKLDLYCKGMRLGDDCMTEEDGADLQECEDCGEPVCICCAEDGTHECL